MAMDPRTRYPGQIDTPSDGTYPFGRARDVSAAGAGDGTPYQQDLVNDIWGFLQSLLVAHGVTPSGVPDAVGASQYFDAMRADRRQASAAEALAAAEITYELQGENQNVLSGIAYGPAAGSLNEGLFMFVAPSDLAGTTTYGYSPDGRTWTVFTTGSWLRAIAHGGPGSAGSRLFMLAGSTTASSDVHRVFRAADSLGAGLVDVTPNPQPLGGAVDVKWSGAVWVVAGRYHDTVSGQILITDDDGDNWDNVAPDQSYTGDFRFIHIVQAAPHTGRILLFGDDAEIQMSDDDGATFTRVYSDFQGPIGAPGLSCVTEVDGVLLVGTRVNDTLLRSTDGGATWTVETVVPTAPVEGFATEAVELMPTIGGIVGAVLVSQDATPIRVLALSRDRGLTWPLLARIPDTQIAAVHRAWATDGQRIVIAGGDSPSYGFAAVTPPLVLEP